MIKLVKTLAAGSIAFAGAASAATISNVSGVVYEGGVSPEVGAPAADIVLGDFNTALGDPILEIVGDSEIYGGVAHRDTAAAKFMDGWTMDFGSAAYDLVFTWAKTSADFDGQLVVDGVSTALGGAGSINIGTYSGVTSFLVDPIFGVFTDNPDEVATWNLTAVNAAAPVPLPAGGALILTGLASFAAVRRRKKS